MIDWSLYFRLESEMALRNQIFFNIKLKIKAVNSSHTK